MESLLTDLGCVNYQTVYELQQSLVKRRNAGELKQDVFLVCEHFSTYTLGKNAGRDDVNNLHVSDQFLKEKNIKTVQIERGGEITYHGPGQLVLYPIISLRQRKLRVTEYVTMLEEVMVRLASHFGVSACRNDKNPGVWKTDGSAKIGSIGIAVRHGVSFHGLAINIKPDLEPFKWITPCGLQNVGVTSLVQECGAHIDMEDAKEQLYKIIDELFGITTKIASSEI